MKLKTHLRDADLPRLQAIAEFWSLTPGDAAVFEEHDALADYLYPRMQTANHFRETFERLDAAHRDWVYFLAVHGGELPADEMRKRCEFATQDEMWEAMEPLRQQGFVWREKLRDKLIATELIGIPEPFVRLIDLPPYWQGFLGYYLHGLGVDDLRAIMRESLDERGGTRKKQALAHYLRRRLLDPKQLQAVIDRLDPLRLEMFQQILNRSGVCAWKDLLDSGMHKKFDHVRADKLRELVEHSGLVFVFQEAENKYNHLLMAPRDIAHIIQHGYKKDDRSLKQLSRGEAAPSRAPEPVKRPGVILDNSHNILRDLAIVCAYIQRNPVKMLNNGGVGRNDLKRIAPTLSHNKTLKYVQFLVLFAICKKLLIAVGNQWRISGKLLKWLGRGQQCFADLIEFWLTTNEWNEEFLDGDVVHADSFPQNLIGITELRKLILRMMERLPSDTWIDFETFAQSLLPQIALEIPGRFDMTPSEKSNRHPLLIVESVVAESLYWLGAVVLGVSDMETARSLGSRPNESIAPFDPARPVSSRLMGEERFMFQFKLSDFGQCLLQRSYLDMQKLFAGSPDPDMPYAEQTPGFTVQPNQELIAPPDLALDVFFNLLLFTDIKKMDIMATLAISRESLRAGLEAGLDEQRMIETLEQGSRRELPETVRQMIGECQSRHGEMDMGMCGGYLNANDPMRVTEILNNKKLAPFVKDTFENIVLLSRTTDYKKVTRELQKMGFLLHVDSDSIYETSDGLFQITLRTEELYDLLAVVRFCIMVEEEAGAPLFEDRARPLFQRLSTNAQERFNPSFYAESIAKAFLANFEKHTKKKIDEATRKYRKQLNRLMTQRPKGRGAGGFPGENPTSDQAQIKAMIKYAIEQEKQLKIHYLRSSGEKTSQVIEPEALQGAKVYAFCPDNDEHHMYALARIAHAAI